QSSPCTWAEINAAFPAAQVYGRFLLHAGSNCNGFDGNADALRVSVNYAQTTYDFDVDPATPTPSPTATATVAPSPTPTPTPACEIGRASCRKECRSRGKPSNQNEK